MVLRQKRVSEESLSLIHNGSKHKLPQFEVIDPVDAINNPDWINSGSAGSSAELDETDPVLGTGAIKCTSNSTISQQGATRNNNISFDMTGFMWGLYVKVEDIDKITQLVIQATNDGFANFTTWNLHTDKTFFKNDEWALFICTWGQGVATGTGAPRTGFGTIQLKFTNAGNESTVVTFGGLIAVPEPSTHAIAVTFDDSFASVFDKARPKMDQYGYRGSAYIIPSNIGDSDRLTVDQMSRLQDFNGWAICAHDNVNYSTISINEVESRIKTVKKYMLNNNLHGANHFAYPNGAWTSEIIDIIDKYFITSRSIVEGLQETNPAGRRQTLRIKNITDSDTFATVQTAITDAIANNNILILVFHNIVDTVTVPSTQIATADFDAIIDELNTQSATVRTIPEIFEGEVNE